MRDNQHVVTQFVKIVERYPVIYDRRLDTSRAKHSEVAWVKIAESVRKELREECSVEELKAKWKGIRSSYGRYKNKLFQTSKGKKACKKYYLHDALTYLEPFTAYKGKQSKNQSNAIYEETCTVINVDGTEVSDDENAEDWSTSDTKQEVLDREDSCIVIDVEKRSYDGSDKDSDNGKKVKLSPANIIDDDDDDDDENLNFFKSILPDIRGFNVKEKRKLKMGILKLIDDLENERQQQM